MKIYNDLVNKVLLEGVPSSNRTGVDTISIFGHTMQFSPSIYMGVVYNVPLPTQKYVDFYKVMGELLWFISDSRNTKDLNSGIWDAWASERGELGPIYSGFWALPDLVEEIRQHPDSRRLIMDSWHLKGNLPPCHYTAQFRVLDNKLHLSFYQRSCDLFLGVPYNMVSYFMLLCMMCKTTGYSPGRLIYNMGDVHIYKNHIDQCKQMLENKQHPVPIVKMNTKEIKDYTLEDFTLEGYKHSGVIKGAVAV